jgi:hypothetical protein
LAVLACRRQWPCPEHSTPHRVAESPMSPRLNSPLLGRPAHHDQEAAAAAKGVSGEPCQSSQVDRAGSGIEGMRMPVAQVSEAWIFDLLLGYRFGSGIRGNTKGVPRALLCGKLHHLCDPGTSAGYDPNQNSSCFKGMDLLAPVRQLHRSTLRQEHHGTALSG